MPYRLVKRAAIHEDTIRDLDQAELEDLAAEHGVRNPKNYTREQLVAMVVRDSEDFLRGELLAVIAIGLALMLALNIASFLFAINIKDVQETIKENQITACESSLEPGGVRYIIAERIREEAEQSKNIPPSFFPNIPPETFQRLQDEAAARDKARIRQLLDVDCQAIYKA